MSPPDDCDELMPEWLNFVKALLILKIETFHAEIDLLEASIAK